MRIGIDAEMFSYRNRTGIPNSVASVLKYWMEDHPEHEYYLFSPTPIYLFDKYPDNWKVITGRLLPANRLWRTFELPALIRKYRINAFWGTNYTLPYRVKNTKYVLTIYDLAWLLFEGIGEKKITNRLKKNLPLYIKRADEIIAISEATKKDIIKEYGVSQECITVSYLGGLTRSEEIEDTEHDNIRNILRRHNPFFLFVSTIEPRKNVSTIIKAFETYLDYKDGGEELILAGGKGWNCDAIYAAVEGSRYRDRIIMPGFVSESEKDYLMQNAIAFLYPSLYEGFGIPILEAFSYVLTVITTRVSSIPEVAGDAALYIDEPSDYKSLAEAMRKAISLTETEKREFADAMKTRLGMFSWKKYSDEVLNILSK